MESFEIKQELSRLSERLCQIKEVLDLSAKQEIIDHNNLLMVDSNFWNDQKQAQKIINETNSLKALVEGFTLLQQGLVNQEADFESVQELLDSELFAIFEIELNEYIKEFNKFEIKVLLSEEYDSSNCLLSIHPGAGGTESQDWAEMLLRMYQRFCEKNNFKINTIDYNAGDVSGIKSVTIQISGNYAYGYLKSEKGVHRLVRISPFDSGGRRHTSFASVDVTPELIDDTSVEINANDLVIETHRASGAGGQHVNTTDSAVRITHKPTGIVATCQAGRSQIENREQALHVLKSRVQHQRNMEEQEKIAKIKGEVLKNEWGSQIRSYVLCPYTLVKDHRTNYEDSQVDKVMDGNLDNFIYNYLKYMLL
ncbi:MAG: peptide chain release factor 2 [Erysipelotrichaceae bacterium]